MILFKIETSENIDFEKKTNKLVVKTFKMRLVLDLATNFGIYYMELMKNSNNTDFIEKTKVNVIIEYQFNENYWKILLFNLPYMI